MKQLLLDTVVGLIDFILLHRDENEKHYGRGPVVSEVECFAFYAETTLLLTSKTR